jgi:hypothetical protein
MPRNITVTFEDGSNHVYQNAPDNITPDEVQARAQQEFGKTITALDGGRAAAPQEVVAQERAPFEEYVRPALEFGGALAGGAIGGASGLLAGPGAVAASPAGAVAGSGLGYAAGKTIADRIYSEPEPLGNALATTGKDIVTGAAMESGGQVLGKALPYVADLAGKGISQVWGGLTGKGEAAIRKAVESGVTGGDTAFNKAMRGKITGEEIVSHAKEGLQGLKDIRGAEYRARLDKIKMDPQEKTGIYQSVLNKLKDLTSPDKFDILMGLGPKGEFKVDFSSSPLAENQNVLEKAIKDTREWKDMTASGLDKLKRRLGTYADQVKQGSPQESFLTQLRDSVSAGLKERIPQYEKMTKGYSEATNLIKDLEAGLMLRKQGMDGRIVADQTLRRLTSAMQDNHVLRRDLVKALENKTPDLQGEIAGFTMNSLKPSGLAGSNLGQAGGLALMMVKPELWPVIAASSPRIAGEFLQFFGKIASRLSGVSQPISRAIAYPAVNSLADQTQNNLAR